MGTGKTSDYLAVPAFRIGVFLMYEGDTTEAVPQSSHEVVVRQIAFLSHALLTFAVEQEHSRRPDRAKTVEPCRVLLDVSFYRKEVFADEVRRLLILV